MKGRWGAGRGEGKGKEKEGQNEGKEGRRMRVKRRSRFEYKERIFEHGIKKRKISGCRSNKNGKLKSR